MHIFSDKYFLINFLIFASLFQSKTIAINIDDM